MKSVAWSCCLLALMAGCASAPFRGPEQGGAEWLEGSSRRFRLFTTQDEATARQTIKRLELTQAVLEQVAFPSTENPPGTTEVVILPAAEYDALVEAGAAPTFSIGYFASFGPSFARVPRFVVRGDLGEQATSVLQHELTHRFVAFHCPNAPTWFNEGLAEFWETVEIKDGEVSFGGALQVPHKPTSLAELLQLSARDFYAADELQQSRNYLAAGTLAQVLYFQHREVLTSFVNLLKSGKVTGNAAWSLASHADMPGIQDSYGRFFDELGRYGKLPAPTVAVEPYLSPMPNVDVRLLWASLWSTRRDTLPRSRIELDAALAIDPQSAEALLLRALYADDVEILRGMPVENINRALALAPSRSAVIAGALAYALTTQQALKVDNAELARRLLKFKPKARHLALLAQYFGKQGDLQRGIALAEQAVVLDSSCVECYAVGSELLAGAGRLELAVAARRAAVALAGEHVAQSELARLKQLEAMLTQQSTD